MTATSSESPATPVPYATDGTDYRGAVRYHYALALKRFVKFAAVFTPLWVQLFIWKIEYLLPLAIVGFIGLLVTLILFCSRMFWIRKCSRVLHTYPLAFRTPVEKVDLQPPTTFFLRLGTGDKRDDEARTLRAKKLTGRPGWPADIAQGIWFAGDDPFGGAALIPGTGELLFMQPRIRELTAEQRENAGPERIRRARRAGIKRAVNIR
jgi:hypothetical protein